MSSNRSPSGDSVPKSKRPIYSTSSNNSNGSGSGSRKRNKKSSDQKQKTLGVAWGSNSISSSSFRSSPFSNVSSYMTEKNRKLQEQFEAEASTSFNKGSGSAKPIFHGVSIFVDGFTVPSSQELRGYMLKHGGRFENYFSRHRVTHIICSNLPDSKIKNLRSFSGGLPVVKATWITESVAANKLLNWISFQLDQITDNQPKLSDFFARKSSLMSDNDSHHTLLKENLDIEDSSVKGGTSEGANLLQRVEYIEHIGQCSAESIDCADSNVATTATKEPSGGSGKFCEAKLSGLCDLEEKDVSAVNILFQPNPYEPSASSRDCLDNKSSKEPISSRGPEPSNQPHPPIEDPNFVEKYFKNSRLHFIGTWKHRYRKRFPIPSYGLKCAGSEASALSHLLKPAIIHIDMDCFFVSVVIRNLPELHSTPVAVCHSNNPKGTAEISSANYPARGYGVRAGMFVRDAKALCPQLVIIPYNFETYEEVADQFYDTLHKYCNKVQAVSCDEAFLDVTELNVEDLECLASKIRNEIFQTTGCTASVGIAGNMLMARLATRTAKPNGQYYIPPEMVDEYLHRLPVKELPGIGIVLQEKLQQRNIWTCGQLRMISKDSLKKDFGTKTGEMLWSYCRGVDNRSVGMIQESKSIGADVNWGVRFRNLQDTQQFLLSLCKEVSLRLQGCGLQGRTFTLKMKKKRKDAGEPAKYMGHGNCENLSHSITIPVAADDVEVLQRITKQLFGSFHIDVKDIRGVGLQVSRLESVDTSRQGFEKSSLKSWLLPSLARNEEAMEERPGTGVSGHKIEETVRNLSSDQVVNYAEMENSESNGEDCSIRVSGLPPLSHLDIGVIGSLPPDLFLELNEIYSGKLVDFINKNKGKEEAADDDLCTLPQEGVRTKGDEHCFTDLFASSEKPPEHKENYDRVEELQKVPISGSFKEAHVSTSNVGKFDLFPSSLSQVDRSVLEELPEELKVDVLQMLPAHRVVRLSRDAALDSHTKDHEELPSIRRSETSDPDSFFLMNDLYFGDSPIWVDKFKASNCLILNTLADSYYKSGSIRKFSLVLQRTYTESFHIPDATSKDCHDDLNCFCELIKQYIKLKIESDIEEIYICFRILKRLAVISKFFSQAYDTVFPYLQASVGDLYGGNLVI